MLKPTHSLMGSKTLRSLRNGIVNMRLRDLILATVCVGSTVGLTVLSVVLVLNSDAVRSIGSEEVNGAWRNRFYVDVGAYDGDTLRVFLNLVPNKGDYKLFGFECSSENLEKIPEKMDDPRYTDYLHNVEIIPACVGTENKKAVMSGKGIAGKVSNNAANTKNHVVQVINLSEWILANVTSRDFLVLKVDIEGGEFDVLPHLIDTGALDLVQKLQLETHAWQQSRRKDDEAAMLDALRENGLAYRFATFNVAYGMDNYTSWADAPKYVEAEAYPKPWVDLHFTRDGVDWVDDW